MSTLVTRTPVEPRQRGTALVVALVFLLLMTLLGISAMRGTALQERMAGNLRDRNLAFQSAEAALRRGEEWVNPTANAKVLESIDRLTAPGDWDGTLPSSTFPIVDLGDDQLASNPKFHAAKPRLALTDPKDPSSPIRSFYPVTAMGTGGSATAVVILQSHCERPCAP